MRWVTRDSSVWRRWFAWYPIYLGERTWVWLETIERRDLSYPLFGYDETQFRIPIQE